MKILTVKKLAKVLTIPLFVLVAAYGGETVKIMPLGDSITYGNDYYNTPDATTQVSYRKHLWEDLNVAGYTIDFIGGFKGGTDFDPPFDSDHQGHPGFTAAQIAGEVYNDLSANEPEVVLLHIGTNELRTDTADVELALNEIDRYENDNDVHIQVILARIINRWVGWDDPDNTNRTTAEHETNTTIFNNNLQTMADARIAAGDDIIVVDMETDSGIVYDSTDMTDDLHPNDSGYAKMANIWFSALQTTLPAHLWKFDEADGATSFVDTYRDNDGTCIGTGCPQSAPGILGSNARLFDGTHEVTVSDDDTFDWSGSDSFTIEFWIKPTRTDGTNQVVAGRENEAGDNYYWWAGILGSTERITFRLRDSAGTSVNLDGPVVNAGEWYHVVCVRDGANNQNMMYVNGASPLSSPAAAAYAGNFAGTTSVNVGYLTFNGSNSFHLDSAVDELTIYNGAMNEAQATLHYERGIAGSVLAITSTPTTLANVGSSYLYDVESTMDPSTTFTYTAIPDLSWMGIDTDTGVISGTVTDEFVGNVNMSVVATNTPQTNTQNYVLQIRDSDSLPAGMSHYWKFDETETTDDRTYIDSYAGADGTCTGGDAGCPEPRPGRINGAQSFDGSDMVDVLDATGFDWAADASFTIEYWIRIDDGTDLSNNMVVIGRDGDSYIWWAGIEKVTGNAIFSLRSNVVSTVTSTETIVGNTGIHAGGHHIAIVRDGTAGETRLYVDGNFSTSTVTNQSYTGDFMDSSASAVNIGYLNNNGTPGFFLNNGTSGIDDMAVFDRAMSAIEIQEHYNNSFVGNSFEALVDNTAPIITLIGDNPMDVAYGSTFTDPGTTASDDVDGDITDDIVVGGDTVDTSTLGSYTITYNVSDSAGNAATEVTRTVNVIDASIPIITLLGTTPIDVAQGSTYADAGATASDDVDGDITDDIVVGGDTVDTSTLGSYTITYNVSDSAGNAATEVTRTVNVIDASIPIITLLGTTPIDVAQGSTYADAGATASDDVDGDITNDIVVGGDTVDTSTLGSYTITYNVSDSAGNAATEVTRTVNVIDASIPIITLLGTTPIDVAQGSTYADAGATASDDVDGDITNDIVVGGDTVDTSTLGSYTITYNVSDSAGNAATEVTRTVNVVEDIIDGDDNNTTINPSSSGGGCTYNPNSKNFDMSFLFMMALGLFYPFRRRFLK